MSTIEAVSASSSVELIQDFRLLIDKRITQLRKSGLDSDKIIDQILEENPNLYVKINDEDGLILFYHEKEEKLNPLEAECRCYILGKDDLEGLCGQYPEIKYNQESIDYLKNINWKQVRVEECFDCPMVLVYFYNRKWQVSTRRCLDAERSKWSEEKNHRQIFDELFHDYDKLNKDYYYLFGLVTYDSINIVNYQNKFGPKYQKLLHIETRKLKTHERIIDDLGEIMPKKYKFKSLDEILAKLKKKSKTIEKKKKITFEGYILKVYNSSGNIPLILKLQTNAYKLVKSIKPNADNIYRICLGLYQKDKLDEYLTYYPEHQKLKLIIDASVKDLANEVLNLYFMTLKKQSPKLYDSLKIFKKIRYKLHTKYIERKERSTEIKATKIEEIEEIVPKQKANITINDVYYLLKEIDLRDICQLFKERYEIDGNFKGEHPFTTTGPIDELTKGLFPNKILA